MPPKLSIPVETVSPPFNNLIITIGWPKVKLVISNTSFRQDLPDYLDFCAFPEEKNG